LVIEELTAAMTVKMAFSILVLLKRIDVARFETTKASWHLQIGDKGHVIKNSTSRPRRSGYESEI